MILFIKLNKIILQNKLCMIFLILNFQTKIVLAIDFEDLFTNTYLLNLQHRTYLSDKMINLKYSSFELSDGTYVSFNKWYTPKFADLEIDFMTQITPQIGVIWGATTGNYGEKFIISPSYKIGFIYQFQPTDQSNFSISLTRQLRGRLREKPCVADYGSIGGIQSVNCRYAASTLDPVDTLLYLLNEKPPDNVFLSVRFQLSF